MREEEYENLLPSSIGNQVVCKWLVDSVVHKTTYDNCFVSFSICDREKTPLIWEVLEFIKDSLKGTEINEGHLTIEDLII